MSLNKNENTYFVIHYDEKVIFFLIHDKYYCGFLTKNENNYSVFHYDELVMFYFNS